MKITDEMIKAAQAELAGKSSYSLSRATVERVLAAALSASPAGVVKPLEWVEHWGGADDDLPSWRGKNPLGLHVSVDFIGKYKLDRHSDAPQDELEAKKSAAFADYSARIMSAIEPAGVGVETPPPSTHVEGPDAGLKPIPIEAAKRIAKEYGYDQVLIYARRCHDTPEPHGEHMTTYGRNREHCDVAARIGDTLKKFMGWEV